MTCQCRLINYNKCTTLVENVGNRRGCAFVGVGCYGKTLYFPLKFAVNLKLSKIKSIKKKHKQEMKQND